MGLTLAKCQPANGCLFSCQMRSFSSLPMSGSSIYSDPNECAGQWGNVILWVAVMCSWSRANHEFIQLGLFKTVWVVFQFDLIRLAPLSIDLQKHLGIRPRPFYVWCPDPQGPWVLWRGRRVGSNWFPNVCFGIEINKMLVSTLGTIQDLLEVTHFSVFFAWERPSHTAPSQSAHPPRPRPATSHTEMSARRLWMNSTPPPRREMGLGRWIIFWESIWPPNTDVLYLFTVPSSADSPVVMPDGDPA